MSVPSSCAFCINIAQVVQSDLSQIGITLDINVVQSSTYYASYGSYSSSLQSAAQIGHLSLLAVNWAPATITPADYWVTFVSNQSLYGNSAIYYNPTVQACVDAFTATSDITSIQSLCTKAQAQIYNDAPYAWMGVSGLWYSGGSFVWQKDVIRSFNFDPLWSGQDTAPLFNTVTFGG
jgi:ABC-type transport system substrate-binding protein